MNQISGQVILSTIFALKHCLLGTVKLVRDTIKTKFIYNGRQIAFDWECLWSFVNNFTRNVANLDADNGSSSRTNNRKNDFLVVGQGPANGINDITGAAAKMLVYIIMVIRVSCM